MPPALLDAGHALDATPGPAARSPDRGMTPRAGDADRGICEDVGGLSGDRCGDDRRDVGGAVPDERRPRARRRAARARTARPGTRTRASSPRASSSGVRATIAALRAPSRQGRPRRGVDRRRRAERGSERRDDVAPGRRSRRSRTRRRWSTRRSRARRAIPSSCPLLQNVQVGESHRLAVLEMNRRPGVWRVWVDGKPMHRPGRPPRLAPDLEADRDGRVVERRRRRRATASASASSGSASRQSLGGSWRTFRPGFTFEDRGYVVRQLRPAPARPADALVRPDPAVRVRRRVRLTAARAG